MADREAQITAFCDKGYAPRNIPGPCGAVGELAFEVSQSSNSGIAAPGRLSPERWRQDMAASLHVAGLAVTAIEMDNDLVVERRFHRAGDGAFIGGTTIGGDTIRSEEHTSELQSLMRISYAVFCLK